MVSNETPNKLLYLKFLLIHANFLFIKDFILSTKVRSIDSSEKQSLKQ